VTTHYIARRLAIHFLPGAQPNETNHIILLRISIRIWLSILGLILDLKKIPPPKTKDQEHRLRNRIKVPMLPHRKLTQLKPLIHNI
jgi:hypothetical protein